MCQSKALFGAVKRNVANGGEQILKRLCETETSPLHVHQRSSMCSENYLGGA